MIQRGDRAPDVLLETPDGDSVHLSDELRGRTTLLVFFKEDCPTCRVAVPRLPRLTQSYADVDLWGISQDDPATTREFLVEAAPSIKVLVDSPVYEASRSFGIDAVPAFVLVGREGAVLDTLVGWDRERFNGFSMLVAAEVGAEYRELVPPGDGPDFRPG